MTLTTSLKSSIVRIRLYISEHFSQEGVHEWDQVRSYLKGADIELLEAACCINGKFDAGLALGAIFPTQGHRSVVAKTLETLTHIGQQSQSDLLISNVLSVDELIQTVEPWPLVAWITSVLGSSDDEATTELLAQYIRINHMLAPWLEGQRYITHIRARIFHTCMPHAAHGADGGICGAYGHNHKAVFYRNLIKSNPFVLDALLESTDKASQLASALGVMFEVSAGHASLCTSMHVRECTCGGHV